MSEYDVVVIGAGPAGYVCAIRTSQLGLRTAIVDKEWLGGVCLNVGCIPSKSLLKNAEIAHIIRERGDEFGFSFDNLNLDFSVAVKRSRKVSERLVRGVGFLMKKNKIDVYMGEGKVTAQNIVQVTTNEGNTDDLKTKNIIIATGASTIVPDGWEIDGDKVVTYKEAILQEKLPKSVVIVGAGAIGVEFATIWNSYGTKVTIVEMLDHLLPLEDKEVAKELAKVYKKRKIDVMTNHKVEEMKASKSGVQLKVSSADGEKSLEAEQALVAIGFKPNSKGFGLEDLGVNLTPKGGVEIDERMATNVEGIWAIGDVTAKLMLAHVGSAQGIVCAENIARTETITLDYEMMPRAVYSDPQVAAFGITEEEAKERGYQVKVGRFPFQANGKALGAGQAVGWVKLITDKKYGEILGAHMVGPEVTELLPELTISQMMELTPAEISRNVHPHPALCEVLMEAAHDAEGHAINM